MVVVSVNLVGCNERENTRALGTLERDRIAHTATANEIIIKLPVLPGSVVKAGDLLVELDSQLQQAQVAKAKAKVAQAEANLDKLIQGHVRKSLPPPEQRLMVQRRMLLKAKPITSGPKTLLNQT